MQSKHAPSVLNTAIDLIAELEINKISMVNTSGHAYHFRFKEKIRIKNKEKKKNSKARKIFPTH